MEEEGTTAASESGAPRLDIARMMAGPLEFKSDWISCVLVFIHLRHRGRLDLVGLDTSDTRRTKEVTQPPINSFGTSTIAMRSLVLVIALTTTASALMLQPRIPFTTRAATYMQLEPAPPAGFVWASLDEEVPAAAPGKDGAADDAPVSASAAVAEPPVVAESAADEIPKDAESYFEEVSPPPVNYERHRYRGD